MAPLWESSARLPGFGRVSRKTGVQMVMGAEDAHAVGPKIAYTPVPGLGFDFLLDSGPSSPTSLPPAEMMMAPGTPASPHSLMTAGTPRMGTAMMARSMGEPTA